MAEKELNLTVNGSVVEIRHGDCLPLREPLKLNISGNIDTVSRFVSKRANTLNQLDCSILVCRNKKNPFITLNIHETNFHSGIVTGKIMMNEDFLEFGINSGKKYSLRDLSDFIKMHRYCFQDVSVAMKLVSDLRNFKAKVNKEIEKLGDNRGNRNEVLSQVVDTNIPESFTLMMPIFKMAETVSFSVEINIIVRDAEMECQLESVEANDLVISHLNGAIDLELKKIGAHAHDIIQIEL